MKKLLLIISALLTLSVKAQTSVYHPFPDSNAVWNIHISNSSLVCLTAPNDFDYSYIMTGDTVVGSYTYHKIIVPYLPDSTCYYPPGNIIGFRNDVPHKKVFCTLSGNPTDTLLYDFNLQVGDTVKDYIAQWQCSGLYPPTIMSIDSILVGNNYRKRWKVINSGNFWPVYFIEGIGSTWDLQAINCSLTFTDETNYNLICFQQNGITLYPNASTNCNLVVSSNSIGKNKNQIKASPNPAKNEINIAIQDTRDNTQNETYTVRIKNLVGQNIFEQQFEGKRSRVDVSRFSKGFFLVEVSTSEGRFYIKKVVIQ